MIEIREIGRPDELQDELLRQRGTRCRKDNSQQFIVTVGGCEAGFMSIDQRPELRCTVIYEIFVLPKFRCRGLASSRIQMAEALARSVSHSRTVLSPHSLDSNTDQRWLQQWYERKGYKPIGEYSTEFEKQLL